MTTYYVSSEIGSDNNAGTSAAAPFETLQVAANHTAPGDTVLVMNGTYTGGDPVLDITTGGTASAPITFAAAPGQTPVINSSGSWNAIIVEASASYIVISGFTVVGNAASITLQDALANSGPGSAFYDGNGIAVHGADHVTIENNTVHDVPGGGIDIEGADYIQVLNNTVYNNAHWSAYGNSGISIFESVNSDTVAGVHIVVSGNLVYGNSELVPEYRASAITDGEGIILDTNPGFVGQMLVQNNTVYGNGGPGIESNATDNAVITGNTVYGNNTQNVQAPSNAQIFINHSFNNLVTNNSQTPSSGGGTPPPVPVAPTITSFSPNVGGIDNTSNVTITGKAVAGDTIIVFDGQSIVGGTTVDASGNWAVTESDVSNGVHTFTATDSNGSGTSPVSAPFTVTVNGLPNLVTNGGFENHSFTGWTLSGNVAPLSFGPQTYVTDNAQSGLYAAGLGSMGSDGSLSQSIQTTAGQHYTLDFWLANLGGGPNDFTVKWNGQSLLALTNAPVQGYTEYKFDVVGTAGTSQLEFDERQDPSSWSLDSISVRSVGSQPPPPASGSVSINDVTISEGNSGTKVATFTVTRSGGTAAFAVNFATSDGTATVADNNYVAASGTLQFGANENTKTISVTINGDTKVEANETFNVLLSNATNGATITDNQGVGTITNDDSATTPPPAAGSLSINDVTISEGNSGTKVATFTVTRSGGTAAFAVNFATSDGTATVADNNYVAASGTLQFGANENTKTISVTINGDTKVEANETFNVLLSNATNGATISDNQGVGTITNDDGAPPPSSPANLVVNGGFETGNFTGWTLSGNVAPLSFGPQAYITRNAQSGQNAAGLGSMGTDGSLSQSIQTTAGQHYTLDFWLANLSGGPNDFTVKWNGQSLLALTNAPVQGYTEYKFDVVGTAGTSQLEFDERQDPSHWSLDSISVSAVGSQAPDTVAPAQPKISSFSPDSVPTSDGHTTATTLTLSGKGEANSTIQVFDGTNSVGTAPVDASGTWNITASNLAVGSHSFTATDTDAAGNTSVKSAPLAVAIDSSSAPPPPVDTTAPAKPNISSFSPDTSPHGDGHTTATTLTLAGTGEASSTIQVFDGTNSVGTASVDASGTWNITASNLAVGSHSFTATDTDAAGNTSVKSAPFAVAIDAAPSSPPISGPHNPWGLLTQFMAAQVGSGSGGTTASPPPSTVDSNPITLTSSYGLLH